MIQERIKDFRVKIEQELDEYSLLTKTDWTKVQKVYKYTAKHIRSLYLIWLHSIAEEMEKDPRYGCANTIEGFLGLNCHKVSIDEILQMARDCITHDGLFKNSRYPYEDAATTIVIAKPELGMRNANTSLFNRGELMGFPWLFISDLPAVIAGLCVRYLKKQAYKDKDIFMSKLQKPVNLPNGVLALPKGLNPQIHKDWLDRFYAESSARQYRDWLDVVKHPELLPLLNKHGIGPDIYSCTNLVQLTDMFKELVENQTTESQQANMHPNMVSAVRNYIEHLIEINGVNIL